MVIFRKIFVVIAAIIFFSGLIAYSYIHINYANTMPRVPDPITGRTHLVIVNHGARVYVTKVEMLRKEHVEQFFFWGGGACFAVIAVLQGIYKTF